MRPREPHEETRRLESPAPVDPLHDESSGLLMPDGSKLWDDADAPDDDLDNIGERTLITGAPMGGFMMDVEDQVEATLVTGAPTGPGFGGDEVEAASELTSEATANELTLDHHDDAPTLSREPAAPRAKSKAPPPAALAAKIHAPAVSELRKPRPSRRTPGTGAPTQVPNVLQAIVSSQVSEPMPAPRPTSSQRATGAPATPAPMMSPMMSPAPPEPAPRPSPVMPMSSPQASTLPESLSPFSLGTPDVQAPYSNDASGLPMTVPTPPGMPPQSAPGVPAHLQPYLHMQGMPPGSAHPPLATQMSPHGYPQLSPSALHQFQPPAPDMSLTSQMRLYEVDELPSQYKLVASRGRWFIYVVSGALAVMVAAAATFLIIRSIRDTAVRTGTLRIASVPEGATVWFDGAMLAEKTPFSVPKVTVGKPYQIKFELAGYRPHTETITMPRNGADYTVTAPLSVLVGKVIVNTRPPKAEVYIDDKLRTVSPDTVPNVPIETTNKIELRLKGYKSHVLEKKDLKWTSEGSLYIDKTLEIDPKSAR